MSLSKTLFCFGILIVIGVLYFQARKVDDDLEFVGQKIILSKKDFSNGLYDSLKSVGKTCTDIGNARKGDHQTIAKAVLEASALYQVQPELIVAVIAAESSCDIKARSRVGAMGLMQLMPDTAKWLGVSQPYSVRENILGGAKYLSYLLDRFDGNVLLVLAAYNAGPETVKRYEAVPPYRETQHYVRKALKHFISLREISAQERQKA